MRFHGLAAPGDDLETVGEAMISSGVTVAGVEMDGLLREAAPELTTGVKFASNSRITRLEKCFAPRAIA